MSTSAPKCPACTEPLDGFARHTCDRCQPKPKVAQSESEKFFAHLNNGGKICVDTTDLSQSGAYWISLLISPKAGERE